MAKIKVMDELLANKIAAGEVVERCASVVKELTENSIDAKSTEIKIELIDAGTREIKITDNGCGMSEEDAKLSFCRHATSKLLSEDDLFHINTLGFRGEALASIASVSEIELKTSEGNMGTIIKINGGKIESVERGDLRKGTIISVRNLFYNTPARLKHLKSLYAELAYITEYINKLALSHPEIRFTLSNNGNVILKTDGTNNLLKTISCIYGIDVVKKMIEVKAEDSDYIISGYITLPEVHRASRNHIITLVNGRIVKNIDLNRVINDSYHSYKPDNRYPIVVLNINLDPSLVDVNVHPTKMDIKFSKFEELTLLISNMIKKALDKKILIPEVSMEVVSEGAEEYPIYDTKTSITKSIDEIDFNQDKTKEVKSDKNEYEKVTLNLERVSDQETVYENIKKADDKEDIPELYPVGLVHGTYIICQNEKGMYLIDQHAAKERINYEVCSEKLSNPSKVMIQMLFPLTIEYTSTEFLIIKENFEFLKNMGFTIEEFGLNSIIVKEHPTWLPKGYEDEAIKKILDLVIQKEKDFDIAKFNDKVAATMACKMSIKANENITMEEMENLISDLRKCHNPYNCPHGRPTIIFYSNYDLERLFKRSGFDQKL